MREEKMLSLPKNVVLVIIGFGLVSAGCGEDSEDGVIDTISTAIGDASTENGLADAFPHSLAASAFPQTDSISTLALAEDREKSVREKIEETDQVLRGNVDECFKPKRFEDFERPEVSCYEFDNDMNPYRYTGGPETQEGGTTDGTHSNGEACMVAFAREQIGDSIAELDRALELVKAMICQVKKAGGDTNPPAEGEEKDYTSDLTTAANGGGLTISEAIITGQAPIEGQPAYKTEISFTDPKGRETELNLIHAPGTTSDEDKGVLYIVSDPGPGPDGQENDPNNTENMNRVLAIKYAGSIIDGEPRMRFEIKHANILNTIDPVGEDYDINFADIPENTGNETSNNFKYVAFDLNPETNEGNLSYWQNPGGSFNEAARGFLFNISASESDGSLSGCSTSGAALSGSNLMNDGASIRRALTSDPIIDLKPTRYYHPMGNNNLDTNRDTRYGPDKQTGEKITRQCFKQNLATGLYEIDMDSVDNDARGYQVIETSSSENDVQPPPKPGDHGFRKPPQ